MPRITKKRKMVIGKVDPTRSYTLTEAAKLVKEITTTKFDASVDLSIRLGVDPRKANQMVRGVVTLPHGTGKTKRFLCFVRPTKKLKQKKLELIL